METTYDFIVVGSGPSGSAVAAGLANASTKPRVLLLEAGGRNDDASLRVDGKRWLTLMEKGMNYGYKTAPQEHCGNRELDYSRGKGMGGSSAINFGVFTRGARDDYEEWARIVGDDTYKWDKMQARFKALENFDPRLPVGVDNKYAAPESDPHGTSGPLKLGYAAEWEEDLPSTLDNFEKAGFQLNRDHNDGDPLGMAVLISSAYKGRRSTAADLLTPKPENLTIVTNSPVQRVLLEDKKAKGVWSNGEKYFASKEVILSAGALDTPRILMHSGLGPAQQLEKYNIPVVQDIPAIGQGLRDHTFSPIVHKRKEGSTSRASFYGDEKAMEEAMVQWSKDGSGHWAKYACETGIGYFKVDAIAASQEFKDLPAEEQRYLNAPTVPHIELLTHFPIHWFIPDFPKDALNYSCLLAFLYNAQSRGEVTLQSSDPNAPLRFDPKFLSHPFDRRVAIESLRAALRVANSESYSKDSIAVLAGPKSESDEDLLEYSRQTIGSSWHMTGTVKQGKPGDKDAVLDKDFKLLGVENLRVADTSATPILASCHIQSVAYVTGIVCAEKLVAQYGL